MPSQDKHGEDDIAMLEQRMSKKSNTLCYDETFSDCNSGQLPDEENEDDLGLHNILVTNYKTMNLTIRTTTATF